MEKIAPPDLPYSPEILVLGCGGTLFMESSENGTLGATQLGDEYQFGQDFPKVTEFCDPTFRELFALDSSDMNLNDYREVAEVIRQCIGEYDGVVVTQGTDTLEFSAPALSFALADTQKPVVLTGAQLPREKPGSDARKNVTNACWIASLMVERCGNQVPAFPEVVVVFDKKIIRGTRCRKYSERDIDAFNSVNAPLLGEIQLEVSLNESAIRREPFRDIDLGTEVQFDEDVGLLSLHPSMPPEMLLQIGEMCSGVILSTYGAGNVPCTSTRPGNPYGLEDAISTLIGEDVPVGLTTRCVIGAAEMEDYENNRAARGAGAIVLNDMLSEVAYCKMAWVLRNKDLWPKEAKRALRGGPGHIGGVKKAMLEPVAGEISLGEELYKF